MELIEKKYKKGENKDKGRHHLAVRNVINDILNGATYSVLKAKLMEDEYGLGYKYSKGQVDRIVREARDVIKKDTEEQMPTLKEDMLARMLDVYTEARDMGDRMNALKALDQINKMFGMYQEKLKVDADIKQEVIIDFGYDKDNSKD